MRTALRLAAADVRGRLGLVTAAALLAATPLAGYLLLEGFVAGIDRDFAVAGSPDLIVQEANSVGEITGSRIPASVERTVLDLGVAFAIPEIHSVAGASAGEAVLVRGVDPARYRAVTAFEVISGRPLAAGDGSGVVMLGVDLAASRGVGAGDVLDLRGRRLDVVGTFSVGTYSDNEAWLTLDGARELLGWGEEISLLVVPGTGPLAEGDRLAGTLAVARRGDLAGLADEWDPIFAMARLATIVMAAATAIVLGVVLWRLAWLRRRDLAVVRALGMSRLVPMGYLGMLGGVIAGSGLVMGVAGSRLLGVVVEIEAFGLTARAVFDESGIVRAAALTVSILVIAVVAAAVRAMRTRPADLLRGA